MLCPNSQVSIHSHISGALKICKSPWKNFFFLLDKTCFLFFHLNWKIAQAKQCIVGGTAIPSALALAVQFSMWQFYLQSFHKSSPEMLRNGQFILPLLDTDLSLAVLIWKSSFFSFKGWPLSMKLMPHVVCSEPVASLLIMFGKTNLLKEIDLSRKKLETESKPWWLTNFLLFPRETLGFTLPNVIDHQVGDICA